MGRSHYRIVFNDAVCAEDRISTRLKKEEDVGFINYRTEFGKVHETSHVTVKDSHKGRITHATFHLTGFAGLLSVKVGTESIDLTHAASNTLTTIRAGKKASDASGDSNDRACGSYRKRNADFEKRRTR